MNREAGFTLAELIIYLLIASIAVFCGFTLIAAQRMAVDRDSKELSASASISAALDAVGEDLRRATRVVPRENGPGAVIEFGDGSAALWFDRPGEPGRALHRRVLDADRNAGRDRVVVRRIDGLAVEVDGALATVTVRSGDRSRSLTVRRRP